MTSNIHTVLEDYQQWSKHSQARTLAGSPPMMRLGGFTILRSEQLTEAAAVEATLQEFVPVHGWVTRQSAQLWCTPEGWHPAVSPDTALDAAAASANGPIISAELVNAQGENWRCQWLGQAWQLTLLGDDPAAQSHLVFDTTRLLQRTQQRNHTTQQRYRCYAEPDDAGGLRLATSLLLASEETNP